MGRVKRLGEEDGFGVRVEVGMVEEGEGGICLFSIGEKGRGRVCEWIRLLRGVGTVGIGIRIRIRIEKKNKSEGERDLFLATAIKIFSFPNSLSLTLLSLFSLSPPLEEIDMI